MPKWCPDNSETLSGCCRNQCPDAAEICTMEDRKNLDSTIEESLGVWETVCIESVFRNWRDPTLHSDSCKEESYKLMK